MNELIPKLKAITGARGGLDERIFMRADKKADYGTVARVMGQLSGAGFKRVGAGHRSGAGVLNVKVDKTLVASVALHVLVIGWGLVSFSSKAFESTPEESLPVDIISSDQLAKVVAGMKTGKKENPKPLVEKVAEAKPVDDAVGKITEKAPIVTDMAPPPPPKPVEKPVEKKPDPPKPVVEANPRKSRSRSRRSRIRPRSIRSPRR